MKETLMQQYGLELLEARKATVGAGSDTWFVTCREGKYVVKYPSESEINHPEREPELCSFLIKKGIPACQFLKNRNGAYISEDREGRSFHLQKFAEGSTYDLNKAPEWLLCESARMLGRIHTALAEYPPLPEGIGRGFFEFMTPERAIRSYERSRNIAESRNEAEIAEELEYRIGLMRRFPVCSLDLDRMTCQNTHGDFFISQLICREREIRAVIDWTTACIHPVVWEIVRSYVYASPRCANGEIHTDEFLNYVREYRKYAPLNREDLAQMIKLFYYQIAVCDYYGQYYASDADNRSIYLHQARFSTKLLRWLEAHEQELTRCLLESC